MSDSIFERNINPIYQAIGALLIGSVFMGFGITGENNGLLREDPLFPWIIMVTMLLSFIIFNCVFSLSYDKQGKYWLISLLAFGIVVGVGSLVAYWASGIPISEASSIGWIYMVMTMCYVIFLTIVTTMRFIVKLAGEQDAGLRGERNEKDY